jgi:hypothetical protein
MVVQKAMLEGLQRFLNSMGFQSLDRAKRSSSRGSVLEVDCVEPDHLYSARVPGERVYEVQLEFANGKWEAKCSCPVAARCKHIAAAMLALEERESESDNSEPPVSDRKRIAAFMKKRWQKAREAAVKLPPSPLLDKVVAHLGRDLRPREAAFLRVVHSSFAKGPRPFTEADLRAMAEPGTAFNSFGSWNVVDLWPAFPANDFYFWLFVAWESYSHGRQNEEIFLSVDADAPGMNPGNVHRKRLERKAQNRRTKDARLGQWYRGPP